MGGTVAVTGGFIGGKYGNATAEFGGVATLTNLVSYAGLYVNKDILSTSVKLGIRFLENVGPSANLNEFRDEERIKSQRERFIWDYWF